MNAPFEGESVLIEGTGAICTVCEVTEMFIEVAFRSSPGVKAFNVWWKRGYRPLFSPRERVCNGESTYLVIFESRTPTAESEELKERVRNCIHHLRSLLDSSKDFEESSIVSEKAYEALDKL